MKREYKTTEFWAVVIGALLWLLDKHTGTNILDILSDGNTITEAKVQVASIAASLREATGSNSDIILYGALVVYVVRKVEKITSIWKKDNVNASDE